MGGVGWGGGGSNLAQDSLGGLELAPGAAEDPLRVAQLGRGGPEGRVEGVVLLLLLLQLRLARAGRGSGPVESERARTRREAGRAAAMAAALPSSFSAGAVVLLLLLLLPLPSPREQAAPFIERKGNGGRGGRARNKAQQRRRL